jgi:8-oxo-dGTP pyrophosphatase MutT (NUDIX family)
VVASDYLRDLRRKVGNELLLVPSVTAIVFDARRRVLLVRFTEDGSWGAPGGSIDPNEAPADAAVREMWEETGLLVEPVRLLGVYGGPGFRVAYANGDTVSYVMLVFECRPYRGELRPDRVEIREVAYFSRPEIDALALRPWARIVLPQAFATGDQADFESATWQPPMS